MAILPIVMGKQGPIPTSPATLRAQLTALVSTTNPNYINNLPSSLIEDVASTDVGGLIVCDQFFVDLVNSVTPYGANAFILNQLGVEIYGIQPAVATNTSVDLIFSGTPGFIIIPGFTVTDGQYQYICTEGGIIGTFGDTLPIHAVATLPGTWPVPAGSVTGLVTSVPFDIMNPPPAVPPAPPSIPFSVTNPSEGVPSLGTETIQSFRTRTLTAGLAASTGMDRYLKTLLWNVPGVIQRLVSVRQNLDTCKWTILVGGGDPYQVAWAIYYALNDLVSLERPNIQIFNISNDNPIIITTVDNHNLVDGMREQLRNITGNLSTKYNGAYFYIKTIEGQPNAFSIWNNYNSATQVFSNPEDGTNNLPYQNGGGIVIPNPLLQQITLNSYPDNYIIPFILPAQQLVTMNVFWNTDYQNYVSPQGISQAAVPALVDYINSLYVGISPLNIYDMQSIFIDSIKNIVPSENVTVIDFTVSFDGIGQLPENGTGVIRGDPYSYFYTTTSNVFVNQINQI